MVLSKRATRTPNGLNAVARRGLTRQIEAHARSAETSVVDLREERASDVRLEVPVRSRRSRHFKPFGVLACRIYWRVGWQSVGFASQ
jgi:hypothetical protein